MINNIEIEHLILKRIIIAMFLVLVFTVFNLFGRIHRDVLIKKKKLGFKKEIETFFEMYFELNNKSREMILKDMRTRFIKSKKFREVTTEELKKRIKTEKEEEKYKTLFVEFGGMETVRNSLFSKNPLVIYKGLLDTDFFELQIPEDYLLHLKNHNDVQIRMLTACILFRCRDEINADSILALEPLLSPIVKVKIFDNLKKRATSSSQEVPVCDVINATLEREMSDNMRSFLQKSLRLIRNLKTD